MNNKYSIGEEVYVYNENADDWNKGKIKEFRIELESSGEKTINKSNNISQMYDYSKTNNKPVNKPVNKPTIMEGLMNFVLPAKPKNKEGPNPATWGYSNILNKNTGKVVKSANNQRKNAHNRLVSAKRNNGINGPMKRWNKFNNTQGLMVENQQPIRKNKEGSNPATWGYSNILNRSTGKVVKPANRGFVGGKTRKARKSRNN